MLELADAGSTHQAYRQALHWIDLVQSSYCGPAAETQGVAAGVESMSCRAEGSGEGI